MVQVVVILIVYPVDVAVDAGSIDGVDGSAGAGDANNRKRWYY